MDQKYSIRDLENLTGIKAHTIRIWEQRYKIVNPTRTDSNIRCYCDRDIRRLLGISMLVHNGMKISAAAALSEVQLKEAVRAITRYTGNYKPQVHGLKTAMMNFDEGSFIEILNRSLAEDASGKVFLQVMRAFIAQLDLLSRSKSISESHEHFAAVLIKRKLNTEIDALSPAGMNTRKKSFLLYLPREEYRDLGLLFLSLVLRKSGHPVVYLGSNVGLDALNDVFGKFRIRAILTGFTTFPHVADLDEYISHLTDVATTNKLHCYIYGNQAYNLEKRRDNAHFCILPEFEDMVRKLA